MKKRFISLTLVLSMIMSLFVIMPHTAGAADDNISVPDDMVDPIIINTADDLLNFVNNTLTNPTYFNRDVLLTADIDVSGSKYDSKLKIGDESDGNGYHGTFDGQGHTIKGLTYIAETANDAGLFSYTTKGAVIRNLVIEDANIKSAFRGGVIVGRAVGTSFLNVSVRNSSIELYTQGAVLDLITFGGMVGGGLVGEMVDSVMYNCETVNTDVFINSTGGVQGVGGNNIFLGGLVGGAIAEGGTNTIEYSRVIKEKDSDKGKVENKFDVAVGAVSGQVLYAGGIAGYVEGEGDHTTEVIDCFSSGDVRADGSVWVSVASGINARCGGIVGGAWGTNIRLERCHYAGNMSSYLLNNVLAILLPITHENYYLYGVLGPHEGVSTDTVKNCYYDYSKRPMREWDLIENDPDEKAIRDEADNTSWSGFTHEAFTNQEVWSSRNFDFVGTEISGTGCDKFLESQKVPHTNKWIIDYNAEMPVHGKSVSVGTDFPNAGTVSIGAEGYRDGLSTESGYVSQITDTYDDTVTLTATVNPGYNFEGWYNGQINNDGTVSITGDEPLGTETTYNAPADDNAVYVAHYTADVIYMSSDGNTQHESQEYSYNIPMSFVDAPMVEGQTFVGWTEEAGSHQNLTSTDLEGIAFVTNGTPVTRPYTLYPVYVGVGANINVRFQETGSSTIFDPNGTGTTALTAVSNYDNDGRWYITYEGTEPDGYMFDGWYQVTREDFTDGTPIKLDNAVRVSRDKTYYVDEDYYAEPYYYVAKFKYKVTAWMPVKYQLDSLPKFCYCREGDQYKDDGKYAEIYVNYGDALKSVNIGKPSIGQNGSFRYWSNDVSLKGQSGDGSWLRGLNNVEFSEETPITKPVELFAMVDINGGSPAWNTAFVYFTDFPGAADIQFEYDDSFQANRDEAQFTITMSPNYNFVGMLHYGFDDGSYIYHHSSNNINFSNATGIWNIVDGDTFSSYYSEYVLLKSSANVNFHDPNGKKYSGGNLTYHNPVGWDQNPSATRKYQSLLFGEPVQAEVDLDELETRDISTYDYPVGTGGTWGATYVKNYKWLGWIDMNGLRDVDKEYLLDYNAAEGVAENVQYITSDSKKALGYVMKDDERVYAPMELYPLYAKYKVNITTNIGDDAGLGENKPNPGYEVSDDGSLVIMPDENDTVTVGDITLVDEDGNEIELVEGEDGNYRPDSDTKLDVDEEYEVKIEYNYGVTVTYHVGGTAETFTENKQNGETLGETVNTKLPELTVENGVFLGWTEPETAPESGYVAFNKETDTLDMLVTSETVVNKNMDLYPVYVTIAHSANIDTDIKKYTTLKTGSKLVAETADGYSFDGWYAVMSSESGNENVSVAKLPEYTVTKEYAVKAGSFLAVYRPIVTYMIPVYDKDGETVIYSETSKYTAAVDYGHAITDGTKGIDPSVNNQVSISLNNAYEVTGWSADKPESSTQAPYTGSVTGPITLYPILKKAENTYTVNFVYNVNDENGTVTDKTISAYVREDTEFSFEKITAPSYTKDGKTYVFSHWTTDGDENQYKGNMTYTVKGDVTFTAQYVEEVKTPYTVYSNWDDNSSMSVTFANNVFPDENEVSSLNKGTGAAITFIGYALVEINGETRVNHGLYAAGDEIPSNIADYSSSENTGKRIYAVWAQIDTATGASLRLSDDNINGMRVMGYVNTDILERVGLNTPDTDYERGMDFTDNEEGFEQAETILDILATSEKWYGNIYRTMFESGFTSAEGVNAFSIIAQLTDEQYELPLSFRAWLRFTYKDGGTKTAYGTFDAEANNRTISNVASSYLDDLKRQNNNAGASEANNWYGLGKPAYDKLAAYAGQDTKVPAAE